MFLFVFFPLQNNINLLASIESDRISRFYRFLKVRQLERGLISDPRKGGRGDSLILNTTRD